MQENTVTIQVVQGSMSIVATEKSSSTQFGTILTLHFISRKHEIHVIMICQTMSFPKIHFQLTHGQICRALELVHIISDILQVCLYTGLVKVFFLSFFVFPLKRLRVLQADGHKAKYCTAREQRVQ